MSSAAEQWAEERWPKSDDLYMTGRARERAAAIEAFNAGLEHAASLADGHSGAGANWERTDSYDRGWYRCARVLAAAIRKEQTDDPRA